MSKRRKQFLTSTPNSQEKYSPVQLWLSLISDSNFAINHTRRNPTPPVSGIYVGAKWSKSLILKDQFSPFSLGGRRGTSSLPAFSFLRDAISGDYSKNVSLEPQIEDFGRGVIWNGGIIWRSSSRGADVYSQLDVDTEKHSVTRVPPDPNLSTCVIYFGECGGRLLLIQLPKNDAMEFKVFEMDRDDFRWIVRYRVDLTSLILPNRSRFVISVISVVRGAKENDLEVVFYNRGKVFSCNLECRTMKVLFELSPGEISDFVGVKELHRRSYQFIESLSPV